MDPKRPTSLNMPLDLAPAMTMQSIPTMTLPNPKYKMVLNTGFNSKVYFMIVNLVNTYMNILNIKYHYDCVYVNINIINIIKLICKIQFFVDLHFNLAYVLNTLTLGKTDIVCVFIKQLNILTSRSLGLIFAVKTSQFKSMMSQVLHQNIVYNFDLNHVSLRQMTTDYVTRNLDRVLLRVHFNHVLVYFFHFDYGSVFKL